MNPANIDIVKVDRASDQILANLMEHYLHDMAEWFEFDTHEDGAYTYPTNTIWDGGFDVFFAYAGSLPIGFAIVGSAERWIGEKDTKDLDEFFIIRRHRRSGIGHALAEHVWNLYPATKWLVRVYQRNLPAMPFWRVAVSAYTEGAYAEEIHEVEGNRWSYFSFDSIPARTTGAQQ